MSLNKAIEHGKEHRKPYRKSKAIDKTCRNHGGCPWCEANRMYQITKEKLRTEWNTRHAKIALIDILGVMENAQSTKSSEQKEIRN